ncbi:hypothetical protein ACHAWF_008228 [Thalassiosira exigua]
MIWAFPRVQYHSCTRTTTHALQSGTPRHQRRVPAILTFAISHSASGSNNTCWSWRGPRHDPEHIGPFYETTQPGPLCSAYGLRHGAYSSRLFNLIPGFRAALKQQRQRQLGNTLLDLSEAHPVAAVAARLSLSAAWSKVLDALEPRHLRL